jgi:hypothetical protein
VASGPLPIARSLTRSRRNRPFAVYEELAEFDFDNTSKAGAHSSYTFCQPGMRERLACCEEKEVASLESRKPKEVSPGIPDYGGATHL